LIICGSSVLGCVNHKAKPPCVPSDGDLAYTKDGKLRADGLFLNWQCYDRMLADANACYDAAK
jgi:hypothetical protein